jgi:hypothetical protein
MGDLLKEAIADAKRVKATAIANARQTILETFQPSVQRLVSSRIAEEEGEEDDLDIDINLDGGEDFGGGEDMGMEEPAPVGFGGGEEEPVAPEGEEEDMELEALMRELDGMDDEEDDYMGEGNEEDWMHSAPTAIKEELDDDGGVYTQAPPPESGKNSTGDLNEVEINEILSMLGEEDDMEEDDMMEITEDEGYDDTVPEKNLNTEGYRRQVVKLKRNLKESYQAITILKKTINEVNLLNAKLMYSQKLLHKMDLTESQKVKVLEAFDRAQSVREVKSKYLDIMTLINKSKVAPVQKKKMTEGSASRPGKQLSPKKPLNEGFNFAPRWQQLAGMKPLDY